MEVDATPSSQVGTISIEISSYVTPGGDNIAGLDAEQIEKDIELFATIWIKMNPRKWAKKHESRVGEVDRIKMKTIVIYNDHDKKIHMT